MLKNILTLVFLFINVELWGQFSWHDPMKEQIRVINNQGFDHEIGMAYARLPLRARSRVREPVWELSRHSSGLSIRFQTDASYIQIRYVVSGALGMLHMPPTGVSGIDMYRIDGNKWSFCSGSYTFGDTIMYKFDNLINDNTHFTYCIFLPLYNEVRWMEIGTESDCSFHFIPRINQKPIVVYGTSITQGACASRPGMAWTNIVQRHIECPMINMGFSGNGKLEDDVLDFINEIDARVYILDCVSNLTQDSMLVGRTINAVKKIRSLHQNEPILLMEHAGYSNSMTCLQRRTECENANIKVRRAYYELLGMGVKNIFYISRKDFDFICDAWVDYVHPSDIGMVQKALVVKNNLMYLFELGF
ncbi:SGNH/GDSL hydrolase family protein [Mediterranea massiliensis]|uniref:SGNH/GDSL hydrolase family protein n=1 Tax=Mediterranea massiliensis TaxID=1841865 RepID=UPI003209ED59